MSIRERPNPIRDRLYKLFPKLKFLMLKKKLKSTVPLETNSKDSSSV